MRVLIIGGAGYIGSHTAKALARAGFEPVVYDNLSEGHRWAVKWGPLVEADLSDRNALKQAIQEHDIAAGIHFAAHAYVGESVHEPRRYFQNNVTGAFPSTRSSLPLNASPAFRSMFGQLLGGEATRQFWSQILPVPKSF